MQKREKIKNVYKKHSIRADNETLDLILKDKKRTKALTRLYKQEEIKSMQEILEKETNDYYFTQKELEFVSKIDLFDPYMINVAKEIWKQKDNPKMLKMYLAILEKEGATNVSN